MPESVAFGDQLRLLLLARLRGLDLFELEGDQVELTLPSAG